MIITSAPCMPKNTYHCGNAIGAICTDLISKYYDLWNENKDITTIIVPWNLHGLPYENLFFEEMGRRGAYDEIRDFANEKKRIAQREISVFIDLKRGYVQHSDTDSDFIEYTIDSFRKLLERGFIVNYNNTWSLNTPEIVKLLNWDHALEKINTFPLHHKKSIIKQKAVFDSYYPLEKPRVFTPVFRYNDELISINPIFQSFIFPSYQAEIRNKKKMDFFIDCSGFSMLKWHYLRQLTSFSLKGDTSIENIVFHGTILGSDSKPMSKHSTNCIKPSDLYKAYQNRNFVRYVLARSISPNNIPILYEKYLSEFRRIEQKLNYILFKANVAPVGNSHLEYLKRTHEYLRKLKFSSALESFYIYLWKTPFHKDGDFSKLSEIQKIAHIFFLESDCL